MEAVAIQKLTVEEFRGTDFDDPNAHLYELIDGEIVRKSAPAPRHQESSFNLAQVLNSHSKEQKSGKIYIPPIDVFLDGLNSAQPDILFIPTSLLDMVTEDGIEGIPTLLVEIISPTSVYRDRVTKKQLYERHGVQEYWLVDPQDKLVEIYALPNGRYDLLSAATPLEGVITSNLLPGLTLDVNALFSV
ncbi:MAG: Uma2 family endonuclease [Rudanella sp.]|nr:Uma2 family endonuclease [Rudanella sp.]